VKRIVLAVAVALAALAAVALAETLKPDPNRQAGADGCKRDTTAIYTGMAPNWVYVNDKDAPASGPPPAPQWASGRIESKTLPYLAARIASSDDPITHRSYDFNIDLKVDPAYDALTGTSRDGTPAAGSIHLERETGSFPMFAWPAAGDRATVLGSWVWDCDHYAEHGEETEFHPYRAAWIERNPGGPSTRSATGEAEGDVFVSSDATPAGIQAECAHATKSSANAFRSCLHDGGHDRLDVSGDYSFDLSLPPRPSPRARLRVRVVDRGSASAPRVNAVFNDAVVKVSFHVPATAGRVIVAKQVFAGWVGAAKPEHLRLTFERALIRRAMDPSCAPDKPDCPFKDETTFFGQIGPPPGEWQIQWNVAGTWGLWSPLTLHARDGQSFKAHQSVDFYVPRGRPWSLVAEARECDFGAVPSFDGPGTTLSPCPRTGEVGNPHGDDYAGGLFARYASPARSLGTRRTNSTTAGSSCPPSNTKGCYQLTYRVTRVR